MPTVMTKAEREAFLTQKWVAVISIPEEGRGPLTVPVWYLYESGGDAFVWTGSSTRKAQLVRKARRMSLCVQDPNPPYKYVSIEGPVAVEPVDFERHISAMAHRYLDEPDASAYLDHIKSSGYQTDIILRLTPEHWLTVDYSKVDLPGAS